LGLSSEAASMRAKESQWKDKIHKSYLLTQDVETVLRIIVFLLSPKLLTCGTHVSHLLSHLHILMLPVNK
jgi:hypothetical protein